MLNSRIYYDNKIARKCQPLFFSKSNDCLKLQLQIVRNADYSYFVFLAFNCTFMLHIWKSRVLNINVENVVGPIHTYICIYAFKWSVMASVFFLPIWTNAHHLLVWPRRVLIYSASLSVFQLSHYATWKHTNMKCHKRIACIHVLAIPLTSGKCISVSISFGYEQMPIYKWLHSGYYFFLLYLPIDNLKRKRNGAVEVPWPFCVFLFVCHMQRTCRYM